MSSGTLAPYPLRLKLSSGALCRNFRWFQTKAGVPAIPAVKADGYGLGAAEVVGLLEKEGAREFAVSTWYEAERLNRPDLPLLVLHGFTPEAAAIAKALPLARPVLDTPTQCAAWRSTFDQRPADLMVDTGMNRLGLKPSEYEAASGLNIEIVHSHLACADELDHPLTAQQRHRFQAVSHSGLGRRYALANSAGICLGADFAFDAVRPGLGLYGGQPHPDAQVDTVVFPEAQVLQIVSVPAGETVGYGATWEAVRDSRIAIINCGYADGIIRRLSPGLDAHWQGHVIPSAGRISMDMTAFDITGHDIQEGDWLALDWDLPELESRHLVSQYELLTRLSPRFKRIWES